MDAALVVQVDVLGGVAGLAAADAGVEVEPFPGVTTRDLRAEILIVQLFSKSFRQKQLVHGQVFLGALAFRSLRIAKFAEALDYTGSIPYQRLLTK